MKLVRLSNGLDMDDAKHLSDLKIENDEVVALCYKKDSAEGESSHPSQLYNFAVELKCLIGVSLIFEDPCEELAHTRIAVVVQWHELLRPFSVDIRLRTILNVGHSTASKQLGRLTCDYVFCHVCSFL